MIGVFTIFMERVRKVQKNLAFEVNPMALVETVIFHERKSYEYVQNAVFSTTYALTMMLNERHLECYGVDLLVIYHDAFGDDQKSYYDAIEFFAGIDDAMEIVKLVMVMYENHIGRDALFDGVSVALRELKRKARRDA